MAITWLTAALVAITAFYAWVTFKIMSANQAVVAGMQQRGLVGHSPLRERPVDMEVWLGHVRDGKSWQALGDEFFPTSQPEARRSEARRAYARVERVRDNDDGLATLVYDLRARIEEVFGVSAEDFRSFITTGRIKRPRGPRKQR